MEYTFHVGVMREGGDVWPREVVVRTDAAGPPFVDRPIFDVSNSAGTANIILKCASEEYGPISHYWLIVLPGNFTNVRVNISTLRNAYERIRAIAGGDG